MDKSAKSRVAQQEKHQLYKKLSKVYFMIQKRLRPSYDIVVSLKDYLWPKAILNPIGNRIPCLIIQCQRHSRNNANHHNNIGSAVIFTNN